MVAAGVGRDCVRFVSEHWSEEGRWVCQGRLAMVSAALQAEVGSLQSLADEGVLRSKLAQVARCRGLQNVSVGFIAQDEQAFAATGPQASVFDPPTAAERPIAAGCLVKPLTATLIAEAVANGSVGWDEDVGRILTVANVDRITVTHLLNHTHGVDASLIEQVPRGIDGFIDVQRLCGEFSPRALSSPGALYSYSDAGGWLAGAVLERIHGVPYGVLLRRRGLLGSAEVAAPASEQRRVPRYGQGPDSDLPAVAAVHSRALRAPITDVGCRAGTLARVEPVRRGCLPGLEGVRCTCLGHNSNLAGQSAVVRFFPQEQTGIIVSAEEEGAAVFVLAGLCGMSLPEFASFRMPRLFQDNDRCCQTPSRLVGSYSRANSRLTISVDSRAHLFLVASDLRSERETTRCRLQPAEDQLFIPETREDPNLAFLQFVGDDPAGAAEYLWNGRQLWRRE